HVLEVSMSVPTSSHHAAARPPWTVRVAMWSARHRWPLLALWFLCTIGVFILSIAMGGNRTQGAVSQNTRAKYESTLAYDLFGAGGAPQEQQSAGQDVFLVVSSRYAKVTDPAYAATIADMTSR